MEDMLKEGRITGGTMKAKLTADLIKTLKPEAKLYKVRDTEISGFLVRVAPSGSVTFYLDYRTLDGRRKDYRIGRADKTTITVARRQARAVAGRIANGDDPQGARINERREDQRAKASTLGAFMAGEDFTIWAKDKDHRSRTDVKRRVVACFPDLLPLPMEAITTWSITRWRLKRREDGTSATTIYRDIAELKRVFGVAAECGHIDKNPLKAVNNKMPNDNERVRYLDPDEERRLRGALTAREARKRARRDSGPRLAGTTRL